MRSIKVFSAGVLTAFLLLAIPSAVSATSPIHINIALVPTPVDGGIKLDIPDRFMPRFERWKAELLSTEIGRGQWEQYSSNKQFVLTIKISKDKGKGAGTDTFEWDDQGRFVGATITLGPDIDDGFPSPIYYPVLNSLSDSVIAKKEMGGVLLAAAKISHEIGHVIQTESANVALLKKQFRLIPEYTSIFLKNGFNAEDDRLLALKEKIGGTPIEVWESREYWSEVNAMQFLQERIRDEDFYCGVFGRIRQNVAAYAREYGSRFDTSLTQCGK